MCNSKCFAKPEKMKLLDILKMRGDFARSKGKETTQVKLKDESFDLANQDIELLREITV